MKVYFLRSPVSSGLSLETSLETWSLSESETKEDSRKPRRPWSMRESEAKRDWRREKKTWSLLDSMTKEDSESNQLQTNLRRYSYEPRKLGWYKEADEVPVFVV